MIVHFLILWCYNKNYWGNAVRAGVWRGNLYRGKTTYVTAVLGVKFAVLPL